MKCDMCQQNCVKLIAPFAGIPEKYCLPCFTTGIRFSASQKPELAENYNRIIKHAQEALKNKEPYSITFISKNPNPEKMLFFVTIIMGFFIYLIYIC